MEAVGKLVIAVSVMMAAFGVGMLIGKAILDALRNWFHRRLSARLRIERRLNQ